MQHSLMQIILCLLLISSFAQAGEIDACYQASFKQIDRINDLPPEVLGLIYANQRGERDLASMSMSREQQSKIKSAQLDLGIADRGGSFSPGCTPTGDQAMSRLIMAASSPECLLVAIEHGGAGHGAGLRIFLREGDTWERGDKFEHPRAQLSYQGAYKTDLSTFVSQANYELGRAFYYGNGVNKDLDESLKWHLLAANQGHGRSQFEVGKIYAEGKGVEKSIENALFWFEKSEKSNSEFEYRLGVLYLEGKIIPQDIKIGLHKIKSAAASGNPRAQVYLGKLYVTGKHIKKNYTRAMQLFRKAIYRGGRIELAGMYKNGLGVKKNNVIAWALISGAGGFAYQQLPNIEKEMSQQELQAAKQLRHEADGYVTKQGKYIKPKGILKALDAFLKG